ncbi:hypothetical protein M422DRAFT_259670 [Sphaerobolus stellatus SS14]|uniref:Uncharacterized protein n=1 Tax=Sphaerobolus stellatus (strain SS14) TaxID=990650 RepID=A0A0C9V8G6_SPHS4|nr:hypothetical protein M422DRAFT_259670 [Sphaerobolus stellatus SS14]
MQEAVAHIFKMDPSKPLPLQNPKGNIQYSLGKPKGTKYDVECFLLQSLSTSGDAVLCTQIKLSCTGCKKCNFNTSVPSSQQRTVQETPDAWQEVFQKTLALFCAIQESGCPFAAEVSAEDFIPESPRACEKDELQCPGKIVFCRDSFHKPFLQCEHQKKGHRAHLYLCNLQEIDSVYLEALFCGNMETIHKYEEQAHAGGFGPLVSCDVVCSAREQKTLCLSFHRNKDGKLTRGVIEHITKCPARFEFYYPNNANDCPFIAVICRNPHSHSNPIPSRTPRIVRRLLEGLLSKLGWRLADATPRRLHMESSFLMGLRKLLGWSELRDPTLSDLHPSLGNTDHAGRIISEVRNQVYLFGTGFEGAKKICNEQALLPKELIYVRTVKTHDIKSQAAFHLNICMFPGMSALLLEMKRISIDTSFKRVHKWQEFEIEAWFSQYNCSMVVARAFINAQSSEAHLVLFQRIFGIAEADMDGHRGQAIGWGKFCQSLCQSMAGYCVYEITKPLHIHVVENVRTALMSLASAEELPLAVYTQIVATIRGGGKKAVDWFRDKEAADGWALAAIYRTKLAVVAGILFGQGVDFRQLEGIEMLLTHGITHRDQPQTYFRRSGHTIIRSVAVQGRKVKGNDSTLQKSYTELSKLQDDATKQISTLKRAMEKGTASEPSIKRLRTIEKKYGDGYSTLSTLECRSSGHIQAPELIEPSKLLPSHVFEVSQSQKPVQPHHTSHCTSPLRPPPPQFVGSHQTYSNSSAPLQFLDSHEPPHSNGYPMAATPSSISHLQSQIPYHSLPPSFPPPPPPPPPHGYSHSYQYYYPNKASQDYYYPYPPR